jgi:molybdenum cofactor cytidylyltransferase
MSRRMGRPKTLLPFGAAPMVRRVVETLFAAGGVTPVVVVTGHERMLVEAAVSILPVELVHNPHYEHGEMLSSVQAGVGAVVGRADAVVLALADQPAVTPAIVRSLIDAWRESGAPLAAPLHDGRHGHPIVIAADLLPEILDLGPQDTLKTLVRRHESRRLDVPVADPAVLADVDTPEDYTSALERFAPKV